MNTVEFSNEFDTLVSSYRRFKDFDSKESLDSLDFNEYEKSIFLTKAQWQIVIELYTGRNDKGASFEGTEELRASLRGLLKTDTLNNTESGDDYQLFSLPEDLLYIVYEEAITESGTLMVTPITWDAFHVIRNNPFKRQNNRRALRLDLDDSLIKVIRSIPITKYNLQYLSKPTPIVLENFSEVSIDGFNTITECKLDSSLHRQILERAVSLAIASKGIQQSQK